MIRLAVFAAAAAWPMACRSPLDGSTAEDRLRQSIDRAIEVETAGLPEGEPPLLPAGNATPVEDELAPWRDELEAIGPRVRDAQLAGDLGVDLTGSPQVAVLIDLQQAIENSVRHNLPTRIARLQPAITEEDVIVAEAVFDSLFFTNVDLLKTDEPTTTPVLGGIPLGTGISASESARFDTGIRKRLTPGTEVTLSTDLNRTQNNTPGFTLSPDPAYRSAARLSVAQPLLRGFGSDVNTATIRLSRNVQQRSLHDLERQLLRVVQETETAYWNLVLAWEELVIQEWLVDVGIDVRETLAKRRELDTTAAQFADAVAVIEQRRADVIRARRLVRATSDRLKTLMNDPSLSVGGEAALKPADRAAQQAVSFNLAETIRTAASRRPEVRTALLGIDDASIRRRVADNARLPLLNLRGEAAWFGLDDAFDSSYGDLSDGDFISYVAGLSLEYPLGNRAAEAEFRQAGLRQTAALLDYRRAVQDVVADVKSRLRDVMTNHELIQATRSFRIAQAANLRALRVEEDNLAELTPEFLNLKFQRQQTLAQAQREENLALSNYNKSVAALYEAMGTGLAMKGIEVIPDESDLPMEWADASSE
jgi:outer membrane protein TolC